MLISHINQFIYTKTAKTAGTSVESYFEKFCMPEDEWEFSHARDEYVSKEGIIGYRGNDARGKKWVNHMSALEIRNNIGNSIWNSYFKFCVIRKYPLDFFVFWLNVHIFLLFYTSLKLITNLTNTRFLLRSSH